MDQQTLELAGVVVAALSAVATAVSAVVIAVQAGHTRDSADASKAAVEVANATLREAQFARLDALAPHIFVQHHRDVTNSPVAMNLESREKAADDYTFRLPRDANWRITQNVRVRIKNEGPRSVPVRLSPGILTDDQPFVRTQVTLGPGDEIVGHYTIDLTLAQWVTLVESQRDGQPVDTHTFLLTYVGAGDSDVTEIHRLVTQGSVVKPVPEQDAAWRMIEWFDKPVEVNARPLQRVYWKSRQDNETL